LARGRQGMAETRALATFLGVTRVAHRGIRLDNLNQRQIIPPYMKGAGAVLMQTVLEFPLTDRIRFADFLVQATKHT